MEPRIENLHERKLIGIRMSMSLADNKTGELWKTFMSHRKDIANNITSELISLSVYDHVYFNNFDRHKEFEKWAAVEVSDFTHIPKGMKPFLIPPGLYALFNYKGLSTDTSIFQFIFNSWLPDSGYELDNRPHFEILGKNYKNDDPESEEEIWIPVKPKNRQ